MNKNFMLHFTFLAIIVATVFARNCKMECKPNTKFREDCNTCVCTADGRKVCTKMSCSPPVEGQTCVPNSSYKADCNTCHCNADGTEALCTLLACAPPITDS